MRGMRTGLPRWARGSGLGRRWPRKPAPPSLLQLIREDNAQALQARLCIKPLERWETDPDSDFFQAQWPRLLRHSCENMSPKCLELLVKLKPQCASAPPPLPPRALAWLLAGLKDPSAGPSAPGIQALLTRVAESPISLGKEDGLRVMRLGGWHMALGESPLTPGINSLHPNLEKQWRAWCSRKANMDAAIAFVGDLTDSPHFSVSFRLALDCLLEHIPSQKYETARKELGDVIMRSGLPYRMTAGGLGQMFNWAERFRKMGWPLDHPAWERWGTTLMDRVSGRAEMDGNLRELTRSWARILLSKDVGLVQSIPSWGWSLTIETGVMEAMDSGIRSILEAPVPKDWDWVRANGWLRDMDLLELKLAELGWREGNHSGWCLSLDQALGEGWESDVDLKLKTLGGGKEANAFQAFWTQWRQRRMDSDLPKAAIPARSKMRL